VAELEVDAELLGEGATADAVGVLGADGDRELDAVAAAVAVLDALREALGGGSGEADAVLRAASPPASVSTALTAVVGTSSRTEASGYATSSRLPASVSVAACAPSCCGRASCAAYSTWPLLVAFPAVDRRMIR
jgi:hypothetical protein